MTNIIKLTKFDYIQLISTTLLVLLGFILFIKGIMN